MKNDKKRILIFILAIICIAVMSISFAGCSKPAEPLSQYDFSVDNVIEVGKINSIVNDGGNPYGENVWRIKEGDERLTKCAELLDAFSKNSFKTCNYYRKPFTTGGPSTIICIFKTEEGESLNYINITFIEGDKDEYIVEIRGSYYKMSKQAVNEFREQFYGMFTEEDLALAHN